MIFYNPFNPIDRDFVNENNQIRLHLWKDYWRFREQDPETRREVRIEKAQTKKRIHQKDRRNTKGRLKSIINEYRVN